MTQVYVFIERRIFSLADAYLRKRQLIVTCKRGCNKITIARVPYTIQLRSAKYEPQQTRMGGMAVRHDAGLKYHRRRTATLRWWDQCRSKLCEAFCAAALRNISFCLHRRPQHYTLISVLIPAPPGGNPCAHLPILSIQIDQNLSPLANRLINLLSFFFFIDYCGCLLLYPFSNFIFLVLKKINLIAHKNVQIHTYKFIQYCIIFMLDYKTFSNCCAGHDTLE